MDLGSLCLYPASALVHRHPRICSLHDHLLQAYLPYFTMNHFRHESDVETTLESFLRSHPDYLEPSSHSRAREHNFRAAFYLVIECIHDEVEGGPEAWRSLLGILEDHMIVTMRFGLSRRESGALKLFRALSEVSRAAEGPGIGYVLRDFFLNWHYELAEHEDEVSLASWCRGVMRSSMHDQDKADCLNAIFALRPDALAEWHRRKVGWLHLHSSNAPTRNWPRRRRAAGRSWWDHDTERRIERSIEERDRLDRTADRRRRTLALQWDDSDYYRWPRREGCVGSARSFESTLGLLTGPGSRDYDDIGLFDSPAPRYRIRQPQTQPLFPSPMIKRTSKRPRSTSTGDRHLDVNTADYMKSIIFDRNPRMRGPRVEDLV